MIKMIAEKLHKACVVPEQNKHAQQVMYWDVIPANHNITLVFNPLFISSHAVKQRVEQVLKKSTQRADVAQLLEKSLVSQQPSSTSNVPEEDSCITLPVFYGGEYALDLTAVAQAKGMTVEEVIQLHSGAVYEVAAVGFAPGFAYLNGLPEALKMPRMPTPRKHIKGGSLAIAEGQTAVYPNDSPAGWHVLGHCPISMFSLEKGAVLSMGDKVRFKPIDEKEYATYGVL